MGLTDLFSRGFYGQGVTVAVLETGFYHTVAPQYRQNIHNINIRPTAFDWYSEHVDQVLPPLEFCNPYTTPLHVKFEIGMGRQEGFRFYHGDSVASLIAEASPLAKILPVVTSLDSRDGSFAKALKKLSKREDVNVINMSRILETKVDDETQLNPRVLRALEKCAIKGKIITFSACNADNLPIPTNPTRDWINVQTLNNLNLNLIADFFENASENLLKHTIVSGALNLNSDTIAHYSTWAGVGKARQNYIATKGINYCSIFRGNWDGTSVSAPYTAATCANLLSSKIWAGAEVVESLFDGAAPKPHEQHIYGRGVMRGGDALEELLAN
ncbi:MAG: hypothetical protein BGO67_11885 [Alphaproteobacteria bacterium 41-28]|nr:MAG: hypothetical protein BGO67_11885 [Alphaproteobacteria bacterium 41-28]